MRITVLLGQYPPDEAAVRREAVTKCAGATTDIEFVDLATTFYKKQGGALAAALAAPEICRAAVAAERSGSDAVVVFGSLDAGVEAASHLVNIPVVGSGRVGYHVAAMLGHRIASVVYTESSISYARSLIMRYGLENRVVSIRSLGIALTDLSEAARTGELFRRLSEVGRIAVDHDGADVLFPQGVSMVPIHCDAGTLSRSAGIPVVDGLAAGIRMAEFFVDTEVTTSRIAYPSMTWPDNERLSPE